MNLLFFPALVNKYSKLFNFCLQTQMPAGESSRFGGGALEMIRGLEDEATIMRGDPGAVTAEADTTTEVSYIYFSNLANWGWFRFPVL